MQKFVVCVIICCLFYNAGIYAERGIYERVIQDVLRWNYTFENPSCTTATGGRNPCKDIRVCNFAVASIALGGWPTLCGWVADQVPKVCCGMPLVLGGALINKMDEQIARKRACGKTTYSPGLSEIENNFFKILKSLPPVDISIPDNYDPPLDLTEVTMVSSIGMSKSRQGDFPWMVAIRLSGSHICGGSLIDRSHILTAAHCFHPESMDPALYTVHVGNLHVDNGVVFRIKTILLHGEYVRDQLTNNLALVTLEEEILSPFVAHVCLPNQTIAEMDFTGRNATLLGLEGYAGGSNTSKLHIHDGTRIISIEDCNTEYNSTDVGSFDNEHFLCTYIPNQNRSLYMGDYGGALLYQDNSRHLVEGHPDLSYVLIGVAAFPHSVFPNVYTRVSSHMDWILRHTE